MAHSTRVVVRPRVGGRMNETPQVMLPAERARALEILRAERKRYALSRAGRFAYRALRITVSVFVAMLLVTIALGLATPNLESVAALRWGVAWIALVILGGLCIPTALVLLVFYISLQRLSYMGLASASEALWRARRRPHLLVRIRNWIPFLAAGLLVYGWFTEPPGTPPAATWGTGPGRERALDAAWMWLIMAVPFLAQHLLRRAKEWHDAVEDVDRLAAALGPDAVRGGEAAVEIPRDALERIARIESAQIARARLEAVAAADRGAHSAFAVVPTPEFSAARSRLPFDRQAELLEVLERVTDDPRSGQVDPADRTLWHVRTDAGTEIAYAVDDERHLLRLVALSAAAAASAPPPLAERA